MRDYSSFPIVIVEDRYTGVYSGHRWLVFPQFDEEIDAIKDLAEGVWGDDSEAVEWFSENGHRYWGGNTPDEALTNFHTYYPEAQTHFDSFLYRWSKKAEESPVNSSDNKPTLDASLSDITPDFWADELTI